jgi:hypothetical protein
MRRSSSGVWPRRIGGGVVGAVIGFAVISGFGLAISAGREPGLVTRTLNQAERAGTGDVACQAQTTAAREERDRQVEQLEELRFTERLLRGQLGPIGGLPTPWPPDRDAAATRTEVREALAAAGDALPDVDLVDVDCSEFPCIATAIWTGGDYGSPAAWMDAAALESKQHMTASDGVQHPMVVVIGADELGPEAAERTKVRSNRLLDALAKRAFGEGVSDER